MTNGLSLKGPLCVLFGLMAALFLDVGEGFGQSSDAISRLRTLETMLPEIGSFPESEATADAVALRVAPAIWPTASELYLPRGLPQKGSSGYEKGPENLMYFRISRIAQESPRDPASIKELHIRYFFYFENETGDTAHVNDLESAEMWVLLERDPSRSTVRAFLWKIFGAAHGLAWSTNIADLSLAPAVSQRRTWAEWLLKSQGAECESIRESRRNPDPARGLAAERVSMNCFYKPVLFVEEGKHAVAPDVNADGFLTPIIDLNASHADAWGIRDSLGTDSRVPPAFTMDSFVPRDLEQLRLPKGFPYDKRQDP